jgi:CheY-like chemotaxis protein
LATPATEAAQFQRRKVLVADDNEDAALSLAMLLQSLGHEIRTAHNGLEALEVAEEFHPEVMFLDIAMPKLDGYETARRVRSRPWARHTLLVALTGWGQQSDRERTKQAGFERHIVKPVDLEALRELLTEKRSPPPSGL